MADDTKNLRILASGPGWRVSDVVCTAGPHDRPFEEQHEFACVAVVTAGTFQYRSSQGAALLAPGAVMLGNHGHCYECGHEHGSGDRCIAFHFGVDRMESIAASVPGARSATFRLPRLPPLEHLLPHVAAAETAREEGDAGALEELALEIAGAVVAACTQRRDRPPAPSPRDVRRVSEALRQIETRAPERLTLAGLARDACMSAYHFLRTFRAVDGMTPHQFILRTRLQRAAVRLRHSEESISAIAFDAGFEDLSTFNRRFRRVMGQSPSTYRTRRAAAAASNP